MARRTSTYREALLVVAAAALLVAPSEAFAFGGRPHHGTIQFTKTQLQATNDSNFAYDVQRDFSPTGNSKYPMIPNHIKGCSDLTDQLRTEQGPPPVYRAQISDSIKACSDLTDELRAKNGAPAQYRTTLSREVVGASTLRDTRSPGHNGLTHVRSTLSREVVGASTLRDDLHSQARNPAPLPLPPLVAAVVGAKPDVFLSEAERNVMIRDYPQRAATEIPPGPPAVAEGRGPAVAAVPEAAAAAFAPA
jgi:hypothetical protein